MTKQTARAEDEAATPAESAAPAPSHAGRRPRRQAAEPDPVAVAAELQGQAAAHARRHGKSAQAHRRAKSPMRGLYGVTSFARDVLGVADNMRRALDAVTPELRASAQADVKALIDGVELTERELLKALEKNGVRQFTPQGEKFDPNLHQAMFEVPDASVPAGSVVQVVQPGYMIGERVLRPALVGVSKGGPKAAPASRPATTTTPRILMQDR